VPARRCTLCGINYPNDIEFQKCPVHTDESTIFATDIDIDPDWEWRSTTLLAQLRPADDPLIPFARDVPIRMDGDQLFVSIHDVIRAGLHKKLHAGDIIRLEHRLRSSRYSILYEVIGRRDTTREYWIRRLILDPHEAGVTSGVE
jgi:hypothetical protein